MQVLQNPIRSRTTIRRILVFSEVFAGLVIFTGLLVLTGWYFNNDAIKRILPGAVAMNPATALGFILAGTALLLSQQSRHQKYKKLVNWLAAFLIMAGLLKVFSILTGINVPYDQLLFRHQLWDSENNMHNVMAPNTAINFILVGLALLFIDYETRSGRRPTQYICILISLYSLLSLYGYVYGISALYAVKTFIPMAIHTAVCFLSLSGGILFSRPENGSMAIVIGENSGQIIFMRFVALLLPLFFGWLKLQGEYAGLYSTEFGTALFAVLTYAVAMFFLGRQSMLQYKIRKTRQAAVEAIKENERRLQAILDNTVTPISLKTPLGSYSLVNRQFEKAFGINSGTAIGKTDADLFPKEVAEELMQFDSEIIQQGVSKSFEEKYPQADGIHIYHTEKFPLFTQEHKIYAIGAVSLDITKRKHLEEELRKSHQRLLGILDNLGEGVVVADHNGNFILFNKRAEEILGIGAINVTWENWSEAYGIFKEDGKTHFPIEEMPLFKAIKGEKADNVELFIRNKVFPKGKWIAATGRPVTINQNELIAGVAVFRDITLRKQLEKTFNENEKRLNLILSSIGEGIIIISQDKEFVLFNKRAEEILGIGPVNLPMERWPEHFGIYQSDGTTLYQAQELPLVLALQGQCYDDLELCIKNKACPDGKRILVSVKPIKDAKGTISGAIADFRDVTETRRLEDYIREIQEQFQNLLQQQKPNV